MHLFASRAGDSSDLSNRIDTVEAAQQDVRERVDTVEARATAIETTVKQELTERRDALVSEMRQLETLIERLSRSFESKLADAETSGEVAPQEDVVLRAVKDALEDGRVDLHLQPIVSLPQRRVSFYEGFTRLRRPDPSLYDKEVAEVVRRLSPLEKLQLYEDGSAPGWCTSKQANTATM